MINEKLEKSYHMLVRTYKKMDRMSNYRAGSIIRKLTNVNTKKYWDRKLASYGDSWREFPYEYLLEFFPPDTEFSLLDIGCALGDGCVVLKKRFPKSMISGADFSETGIAKAKDKSGDVNFYVLDIRKDELHEKYDYITLVHTLEHFNDPFPVVEKCLKYVKKALIIQVPFVERFSDPHLYSRGQHRYLFNEETFSSYNCSILRITDVQNAAGYRYIMYKLIP